MIKADNGAQGIEVVREGDSVHFIGHFKEGITSEMVISVVDARSMFDCTGTIEVSSGGKYVGLISYEPQGSLFFFPPNQNHDLITVDSVELKREVKKVVK